MSNQNKKLMSSFRLKLKDFFSSVFRLVSKYIENFNKQPTLSQKNLLLRIPGNLCLENNPDIEPLSTTPSSGPYWSSFRSLQ